VLPPDAVRVELPPIQYEAGFGVAVIVGVGFTVTVTVFVAEQPLELVPVTLYVVVVVGLAVIADPVVAFRSVDGDHV
jgi:hypothetical protein